MPSETSTDRRAEASLEREFMSYASVAQPKMPEISGPTEKAMKGKSHSRHWVKDDSFDYIAAAGDLRAQAIAAMQEHSKATSDTAHLGLTEELEKARSLVRPHTLGNGADDASGEGTERLYDLALLKRKYILPFACEHSAPAGSDGSGTVLIPWETIDFEAVKLEVPEEHLAEATIPVHATMQQIQAEAEKFADRRLPLELLTTRTNPKLFESARQLASSPEVVRFTGLCAHLLYWNLMGHVHSPANQLPETTRGALLVSLQELWSAMTAPHRMTRAGVSFLIPVLVLAVKRGVERIFLTHFPRLFSEASTTKKLVEQINVNFMRSFDPDCMYSRFGVLDCTSRGTKLWRRLEQFFASQGQSSVGKIVAQAHRTTPLLQSVMEENGSNPCDPRTRKMLAKCASDPFLRPSRRADAPQLDDSALQEHRSALYRVARRRLVRSGSDTFAGEAGLFDASRGRPATVPAEPCASVQRAKREAGGSAGRGHGGRPWTVPDGVARSGSGCGPARPRRRSAASDGQGA